ncbi:cytochrome-c peroxidase [Flavobacterium terrisoli]|uniref:cytochrome-c peroxidase n=1 Tax=Flavobacterium terrisoli TaxID=3242195 RepID=UPI002542D434|nr:cytochrome c peroxidase [Flavobacterium buctense]
MGNKHNLLILTFLAFLTFSCTQEYKSISLQEDLMVKMDSLQLKIEDFEKTVKEDKNQSDIQKTFQKCRSQYKKIEWAVEYFTPDPARFINGPALDELEVEENKFLAPNGFQVIEEMIFPNYVKTSKKDLIREIRILSGNLKQVKKHFEAITITPDFVMDATRMEVYRILTLGITGFDSPIALQSITETESSLQSITTTVNALSLKSSKTQKDLQKLTHNAIIYCQNNNDFNTFNRLEFITKYLNPISVQLAVLQKENKIELVSRNNVINPKSSNLFDKNTFDVNAFIPSKEYSFSKEKVALGEKLFYDKQLSKSNDRSCASCHNPENAFTDGLKTNASLNGGLLSRNTPTLTYAAFQNAQFWDMRQPDLEKQSLAVIQNKDEMHGNLKESISRLNDDNTYKVLFIKAFKTNSNLEEWQLQNALASYIRSLNAFNSQFDNYMQGKSKLYSAEEQLGFNLFAGKAKCATCHFIPLFNGTVPPVYKKTEQEVIGTPSDKTGKMISPDSGRFSQYKMAQLNHAFKTPTLRNIAKTAPYMHNGVFDTLEEVVDFYNKGGGIGLGYEVKNQTLPSDKLNLTAKEKQALVAFMKTLTDK